VTAQTHLPQHWIEKVAVLLSVPGALAGELAHETVRFFTAWAKAEGGTATWNPLNTTNHISDAWGAWQGKDYNRITVANYGHPWQGIVATAATLLQSKNFAGIVADLRANPQYTAEEIVNRNAVGLRDWGTSPTLMREVLTEIA
jgi:hypothetical protein